MTTRILVNCKNLLTKCPPLFLLPVLALAASCFLTYFSLYSCIQYYYLIFGVPKQTQFRSKTNFLKFYPERSPGASSSDKLILLWTPRFLNRRWGLEDRRNKIVKVEDCRVTWDKKFLNKADAVLFHPRDMGGVSSFPPTRLSHQRYILFSAEPPNKNGIVRMSQYNNLFNWTLTFRADADIQVGYGAVSKRAVTLSEKEKDKILLDIKKSRQLKNKLAVARISNCFTLNTHRIGYVRELQKHMEVDFFGLCAKKCPYGCDGLMYNYKFVLAFENSFCRDYITEKAWRPLTLWNSIPVVLGASSTRDYFEALPPHSFINAQDFVSPKALADYLLMLDRNHTLYEEYFYWKFNYTAEETHLWKPLCDALQNDTKPAQVYTDLSGWFLEDTCHYNEYLALLKLFPFVGIYAFVSLLIMLSLKTSRVVSYAALVCSTILLLIICLIGVVTHLILRELRWT